MNNFSNIDKAAAAKGIDLSVNIAGITLKNPITTASGTFSPHESSEFYDLSELGAMITKGIASNPWEGNPVPRIAETYGGMINAVGLQNPGVDYYIENELPFARQFDTKVIANVAGHSLQEYCDVVERLNETDVDMLEVNISCPNVKEGGIGFGTSCDMAAKVTREVKRLTNKPIIIKLTPNVTDITAIAKAVEAEGADAVSLINTLLGMKIDVHRKRPVIANKMGGFSGPAIKPVAVRMVYQVRRAVNIPIIGLGGIMTGEDVVEFLMAGADAVSIGTAAFANPTAPVDIKHELIAYMERYGFKNLAEVREAFQG
nr:dihydroorotate dehydrogenase [uncultured Cellulosilyticum sp.]